jgi:hypothetical protein
VGRSGKQLTVCFHVDDLLCASESEKDIMSFSSELKKLYIDITLHTGSKHDYLGIDIDFTKVGFCKLDMTKYVKEILISMNVNKKSKTPASIGLFDVDGNSELLSVVAKMLYLAKRARGDILPTVSFLLREFWHQQYKIGISWEKY